MNGKSARDATTLGDEILKSYVRAVHEQQRKVSEQLLCALEELAASDPTCSALLTEAYLLIWKSRRVDM
jgi:hypothetical protein